jgi:hypothetical protein
MLCSLRPVPSVTASPTDVLVSTRPSKSGLSASGPLGTIARRSSSSAVPVSDHASASSGALSTATVTAGSVGA